MSARMQTLALSFPTLTKCRGLQPWDPDEFDQWATGPEPGHGALCAARFVLAVWNPYANWRCGQFDLMEAIFCWDENHRRAFQRWVADPWWL